MSEIRIMKRGKGYQYRFEFASRGAVRRYINKIGFSSRKEAQEAGVIAYNTVMLYFESGTATISSFTEETKVIDF